MGRRARLSRITRVVGWFRAGHPAGLVAHDYIALFGVLHRDLTPTEIDDLARSVSAAAAQRGTPVSREEIRAAIAAQIHERPRERDVRAVAARLVRLGPPPTTPANGADGSVQPTGESGPEPQGA